MPPNPSVTVVTGATSGVGLDAARRIAAHGGTVVLLCRSEERGAAALESVRSASDNPDVHVVGADLASFAQVRAAGARIAGRWPRVTALVNNAGLARLRRTATEDGFELTLQVNHLSPFLLTHLLLDPLRAGGARVVNVASGAHRHGRLRRAPLEEILRGPRDFRGLQAYGDSKLANVLFTSELARREAPRGVTANALHPGTLATAIWDRHGRWLTLAARVAKLFMGDPAVGGAAAARLVTDPALEGVTGVYFDRMEPSRPSAAARDEALARDLWDVSLRAVGLA